jgi:hypothetical protein
MAEKAEKGWVASVCVGILPHSTSLRFRMTARTKAERQMQISALRWGMTKRKSEERTTTKAEANTGVLRCAQNDNYLSSVV